MENRPNKNLSALQDQTRGTPTAKDGVSKSADTKSKGPTGNKYTLSRPDNDPFAAAGGPKKTADPSKKNDTVSKGASMAGGAAGAAAGSAVAGPVGGKVGKEIGSRLARKAVEKAKDPEAKGPEAKAKGSDISPAAQTGKSAGAGVKGFGDKINGALLLAAGAQNPEPRPKENPKQKVAEKDFSKKLKEPGTSRAPEPFSGDPSNTPELRPR